MDFDENFIKLYRELYKEIREKGSVHYLVDQIDNIKEKITDKEYLDLMNTASAIKQTTISLTSFLPPLFNEPPYMDQETRQRIREKDTFLVRLFVCAIFLCCLAVLWHNMSL